MSKGLEALNDLEILKGLVAIYMRFDFDFTRIEKELRALEIIKETPEFAWYVKIYNDAYEMISDVKGFRVNNSVEELQQMFELLKEVLL